MNDYVAARTAFVVALILGYAAVSSSPVLAGSAAVILLVGGIMYAEGKA